MKVANANVKKQFLLSMLQGTSLYLYSFTAMHRKGKMETYYVSVPSTEKRSVSDKMMVIYNTAEDIQQNPHMDVSW